MNGIKIAIEYIQSGNEREAFSKIPEEVMKACIKELEIKHSLSREEAISIYFEGFQVLVESIKNQKFTYSGDVKFTGFLMKVCNVRATDYKKLTKGDKFIARVENLEVVSGAFAKAYEANLVESIKEKEKKHEIIFDRKSHKQVVPEQIVKAFHSLKDECKLLIFTKDILSLSYHDLYEKVSAFYKMKNIEVCRAKILRCRKTLRALINSEKP